MSPLLLITLLGLCKFARAQIPIPKREVGFVYNNGSPGAPVHLDLYIDQICPYSKIAWAILQKVAEDYGPEKLQLTVHLFPLPYHRNAFLAAKGTHVVDKITKGKLTFKWIDEIFSNIDDLTTSATKLLSDDKIIDMLANIGDQLGVDASDFMSSLDDYDIKMNSRIGWKYCCSRGVSGTPTFMINDVFVPESSAWNVTDLQNVIDLLLLKDENELIDVDRM